LKNIIYELYKPRCLRLALKKEWYEKIKSGMKTTEYREVKPYWDKRIRTLYHYNNTPDFNKIIFSLGYTKKCLIAEITNITIESGLNDLNKTDPFKNTYAIHFKNVREYKTAGTF